MRTQMAEVRGWSMAVRSITEQADMADAVRTFVQTVDRAVALELQAPLNRLTGPVGRTLRLTLLDARDEVLSHSVATASGAG